MFGIDTRVARIVWTIAVVAGLLYCLYAVRSTLLILIIAVFFSYFIYPLVQLAQRAAPRIPRDAAIALVFAAVLCAIVLAILAFGSRIAAEATGLGQELPRLLDPQSIGKQLPLPGLLEPYRGRLAAWLRDMLSVGGDQALPAAQQIGRGAVRAATNLVYTAVVPILSFLMIRQAPAARAQLLAWMSATNGKFWAPVIEDINFLLSRYVRALVLLSLASLLVYSVVLSLLGAPFALLLAGIAALLEIIPVFGPLIGAIIILVVTAFSGYGHVWWLLAFLAGYRIFQDYVLNPYLMHEGVEISPLLVVIGLLAGDELAGVAGIFLAVPVLALIKIIISRARRVAGLPK